MWGVEWSRRAAEQGAWEQEGDGKGRKGQHGGNGGGVQGVWEEGRKKGVEWKEAAWSSAWK